LRQKLPRRATRFETRDRTNSRITHARMGFSLRAPARESFYNAFRHSRTCLLAASGLDRPLRGHARPLFLHFSPSRFVCDKLLRGANYARDLRAAASIGTINRECCKNPPNGNIRDIRDGRFNVIFASIRQFPYYVLRGKNTRAKLAPGRNAVFEIHC